MKKLADYVEDVEGAEILSIGNALELIKDIGDASRGGRSVRARRFQGHARRSAIRAWRRNRMSTFARPIPIGLTPTTTSPSSITASSPITGRCGANSNAKDTALFQTATRELFAVYTATISEHGATLEESLKQSIEEIDGVFTYLVSTKDASAWPRTRWPQSPWSCSRARIRGACLAKKLRSAPSLPRDRHIGSV